jgi:maltooligosyltrehalose trehalohydrolase
MPDTRGVISTQSLGAVYDGVATTFRVWAPDHQSIELVLIPPALGTGEGGPAVRPLTRDSHGYWFGRFDDVKPGARYGFRIEGDPARTFPDPASRFQPEGVHGPSEVVDPVAFRWTDAAWQPPPLDRLVFYELHVGTFTPEGTFTAAIEKLPYLKALGVSAIELMPLADFPGERNWGYDGVALFAPARCYGRPDDLRALVDAAHRHGLAVFLDVVYNHFGPDGAYATVFSRHYFTDRHRSPWGKGLNLDGAHCQEVRRFFIENALYWATEFHVDGLRLDATHALRDDSPTHFLADLAAAVGAYAPRRVALVAEDHRNLEALARPLAAGGMGFDATWADDFHHQARVHTAHDCEGYYVDFTGSIHDLAETLRRGWFFRGQRSTYLGGARGTDPSSLLPRQFVVCIQNHDQVGNRADGARLHHEIDPAAYRALSTLLLLAPQTPLLFMGQEWAATTPFLFFTDHAAELGLMVTAGRREEFGAFMAFADPSRRAQIPDPQDAVTFERSRLQWDETLRAPHAGVLRLYRRLLDIRAAAGAWRARTRDTYRVAVLDDHTLAVEFPADPWLVIARLSGGSGQVHLTVRGSGEVAVTTEDLDVVDDRRPVALTGVDRSLSDGSRELEAEFGRPGAVVIRGLRIATTG